MGHGECKIQVSKNAGFLTLDQRVEEEDCSFNFGKVIELSRLSFSPRPYIPGVLPNWFSEVWRINCERMLGRIAA